jgi:SAM-dependent methyltransferase
MNRQKKQARLWAWHVSALVYERAYIQVAHQTDADFLHYLGDRIVGATVADCGCGPGIVTEKLLIAGAAKVVAIDANAGMIQKARLRLAKAITTGRVLLQHASYEADTLPRMCQAALGGRGFDIILFKRSLYMPRLRALQTLRYAAATLCPKGVLVIVHPERRLLRYAFAPPFGMTRYTPFHLFNRAVSRIAEWSRMEEYTLYSHQELLTLLREAVPTARVACIPTQQRPYNLAVLQVP